MALALKPGPFVDNVCLQPSATMYELKLHIADYIQMEEIKTLRTCFYADYQPIDIKVIKPPTRTDSRPPKPRPPRFSRYASLSIPRSRILNEALQTDFIPLPRKTLNPPNTNMTKYYKYQRNNGHTTNECKALQDKIEEFICVGHLRRFVKREGQYNFRPVENCDRTHTRQNDHRHQKNDRRNHPQGHTDINHKDPP